MTQKLKLVLHAGGAHAELEQVLAAPTPASEGDHYPIPHGSLIQLVREHFLESGLRIVSEEHALARSGLRYFGMLQIAGDNPDYALVVGLRNTHDRSFAAGFCVGSGVFVCDNLAFSSEVTLARKHTRYIDRDLPKLVARGVAALVDHRQMQDERLLAYKQTELGDKDAYATMINLLKARAVMGTDIPRIVKEWDQPSFSEFAQDSNVWRLFNAVTTAARPGLAAVVSRTQALHGVCDKLSLWKNAKAPIQGVAERIIENIEDADVQIDTEMTV